MQLLLAAGFLAVLQTVKGQCDASGINNIADESDIIALLSCTSFTGGLGIDFAYSGAFVLPNINYIGGGFYAGDADPGSASNPTPPAGATPGIEAISLPNLETVETDLEITGAPELGSLSLPKLTTVAGYILFLDIDGMKDISLPALETIGYKSLFDGTFDSLSFGSLKTVASLSISTTGNLDCTALGQELQSSVTFTDVSAFLCNSNLGEYRFDNTETTPPPATTTLFHTIGIATLPISGYTTLSAAHPTTVSFPSVTASDVISTSIFLTPSSSSSITTPNITLTSSATTGSGTTAVTTVTTSRSSSISPAGAALATASSSSTSVATGGGSTVSARLFDCVVGFMAVVVIGSLSM